MTDLFGGFSHKLFSCITPDSRNRNYPFNIIRTNNKLPAFDIFKMSISYLKKEAEKMLKEKVYRVSPDDVKWIITVPAIWSDAAKQFMREAAEQVSH
jgi:molecular chaperone DnaK (HSP70)